MQRLGALDVTAHFGDLRVRDRVDRDGDYDAHYRADHYLTNYLEHRRPRVNSSCGSIQPTHHTDVMQ